MKRTLIALASFIGLIPASYAVPHRDAIAAVLMAEARGEGIIGMTAIAQTIRNRGGDPLMQVLRRKQFSCLNGCTIEELIRQMRKQRGWKDATRIAATLLQSPEWLGNTVALATHYHNVSMLPDWAREMKPVKTVGQHRFYCAR